MSLLGWNAPKLEEIEERYKPDRAKGGKMLVTRFELQRGTTVRSHFNEREEILLVAQGSCRISVQGREEVLCQNQSLAIPSGTTYFAEALEDTVAFTISRRPFTPFVEDQDRSRRSHKEEDFWAV